MGGSMPAQEPMPQPAPAEGGEPPIDEMIIEAVSTGNAEMALEILTMIAEESGLLGGAPMEGAPMEGAPMGGAPADPGLPMGRYGMKVPKLKK